MNKIIYPHYISVFTFIATHPNPLWPSKSKEEEEEDTTQRVDDSLRYYLEPNRCLSLDRESATETTTQVPEMLRFAWSSLRRRAIVFEEHKDTSLKILTRDFLLHGRRKMINEQFRKERGQDDFVRHFSGSASTPSLSIWRRKKEMGKEGLIVVKELKRLKPHAIRFDRYMKTHVSRLLKSDLLAVLAEFQRQDQVFLCMKIYDAVRKEIWYRPDMFLYRDMLMMLARNRKVDEAKQVWGDLLKEEVLFDQHTHGDIIRSFLDSGLQNEAMELYEEMKRSPDPPLSLPYRVILKGLLPYPELRERVKEEFLELFPGMIVYDPPEDLFDNHQFRGSESEDDEGGCEKSD